MNKEEKKKRDLESKSLKELASNADITDKEFYERAAKDILKEGEISEEEHQKYEDEIEEKVNKITDETIDKLAENMINESNLSKNDDKTKIKSELVHNLKKQIVLEDDFNETMTKYQNELKENEKNLDELFQGMKYIDVLKSVDDYRQEAIKNKEIAQYNYYDELYKEVDNILNLTCLKNKISKLIKKKDFNKEKLINITDEKYNKEFKRFYNNLGRNRQYRFVDPSKLLEELEKFLPEEKKHYGKIFLYNLYRYIDDSHGVENVSKNSVFIEGIMRNIYSLNKEDNTFDERDKDLFVKNIYTLVEMML